ncbi:LOW QUALITY PROTEIN: X-box-binding protein 1 [Oncorhynchus tshawytscha]|uniref:LOW QUALITY PROTEIN: X-box-binding protein 1 n=1 Tax=Oncorhynchus tshawytscha TaxID=74940 RepID=UPI001C3C9BAD|nr:LOW QUALITY PROTEIN: X-box-binding protein 1 [Oncorhynchus tshawytscha]
MVVGTAGHKVLLISGQQNGSSSSPQGYSRSISVVLPSQNQANSSDSDSNSTTGPPLRKRQRLTHLSPEEKQLRRKLKNRVAAQTARDRKKAKMGELEEQVLVMELENQKLHVENRLLRQKMCGMVNENKELRQRLGLDTLEAKENAQVLESNGIDAVLGIGSSESAVLRLCVSAAGAGPAILKSEDFPMDTDSLDSTDSESDLLLGILDILHPELFLRECGEQEIQEQAVLLVGGGGGVPAPSPAALGATPVKLEALNELIHFDHIYTKPVEVVCVLGQQEVNHEESVTGIKMVEVFSVADEVAVCVKDEPEEVVIIPKNHGVLDDFLSVASLTSDLAMGSLEKTDAYLMDAYSDSGYERSPSPISDMSSPLCSEGSWDDVFANELFPQLISV